MNFCIYKFNDPIKLRMLSKSKKQFSFFKLNNTLLGSKKNENEEIQVFHYNELDENLIHVVFHIKDEYLVGTRRIGAQANLPFSQYINSFIFTKNNYMLIEETYEKYLNDIIGYIKNHCQELLNRKSLSNIHFKKFLNSVNGTIKKIEYEDENEYMHQFNCINELEFNQVVSNEKFSIDFLTIQKEDTFISISRSGKVSFNTNEEDILKYLSGVVVDAIVD